MVYKDNQVAPVGFNGEKPLENSGVHHDDISTGVSSQKRLSNEQGQDSMSVPLSTTGFQRILPRFLRYKFAEKSLEDLYMSYFRHQRHQMLSTILVLSVLVDLAFLIPYGFSYSSARIPPIVIIGTFLLLNLIITVFIRCNLCSDRFLDVVPYLLWVGLAAQIYTDIGFHSVPYSASQSVGWQILFIYSSYLWIPLGLFWCICLNAMSSCVHTIIVFTLSATDDYILFRLWNQLGANAMLFICVNILGTITFMFADRKLRRAFLETKSSLSTKVVIEEEYKQQERLLLSVLPKHVASEMVKDMGGVISGQFRKIYMSRHENVSILFADIVGFTAISSTVSAQELVGILNELFASFDKLAMLYCQLRIKILGDCYYCICGAPDPRPDHAVLSIHMGLAVVEAISEVREKTKTNVNMRVGIHTGAVLDGVLGQKQWQFDVLGKEVTLANKMESGGIPGRVHISEETKSLLQDEFELEPGNGEQREDYLRMTGTKTYLVKSVQKPFPEGTLLKGTFPKKDGIPAIILPNGNHVPNMVVINDQESSDVTDHSEKIRNDMFQKRLEESLMGKEPLGDLWHNINFITLRFKNKSQEDGYIQEKEHFSGMGMVGLCFIPLCCFLAQLFIAPKNRSSFVTFAMGQACLIVMATVTLALNFPQSFPRGLVTISNWMEGRWLARSLWGTAAVCIMASVDIIDMFYCDVTGFYNATTVDILEPDSSMCQYPSYFIYFGELCLVGVTLLVQISFLLKMFLILVITCAYVLVALFALPALFDRYESVLAIEPNPQVSTKYILCAVMCIITLILLQLNRAIEEISRRLYFCKEQAETQKEEVTSLRQKNEDLVYNILPPHVAKDFIGRNMRDEELYSKTHEFVGVMFASCPNFNDFYSEDAINNNGLECLRFLNEIISDYDELLKDARFKSITKIKTVQSTYMAASGMNTESKPGASSREKWKHLDDLLQFGFSLKDALDKINAQSFNTFVLRIGINHGPIVAGVIGARKPHYDIWGNTVNVSSRMDSTGMAGRIQVVEETMFILQEFGYTFEKRGVVSVKGKGQLLTYFVNNRDTTDLSEMPNQMTTF